MRSEIKCSTQVLDVVVTASLRLMLTTSIALVASTSLADILDGPWLLTIENLDHEEVASLVVQFTENEAQSCLGGAWKRIVVLESKTTDERFFPVTSPLSYNVDGSTLTIGRNEVCDAYLHLRGSLENGAARGPYYSFGWRHQDLGFFVLRRQQ